MWVTYYNIQEHYKYTDGSKIMRNYAVRVRVRFRVRVRVRFCDVPRFVWVLTILDSFSFSNTNPMIPLPLVFTRHGR